MKTDLTERVGRQAAKRLSAYASSVRAKSPVPVVNVVLFGSRARGEAAIESDWDVAVVVGSSGFHQKTQRGVIDVLSDLALPYIVDGFHLRPILIYAPEGTLDPARWKISPRLAHNILSDGVVIN